MVWTEWGEFFYMETFAVKVSQRQCRPFFNYMREGFVHCSWTLVARRSISLDCVAVAAYKEAVHAAELLEFEQIAQATPIGGWSYIVD